MKKWINSTYKKLRSPRENTPTYLPTQALTLKSLVLLCLTSARATTNKNKPKLTGINIVTARNSASPLHGCMHYSLVYCWREGMKPAPLEYRNILGLIPLVFTGLMPVVKCPGFFLTPFVGIPVSL